MKNKKIKKWMAITVCITLAISTLIGCGQTESDTIDEQTNTNVQETTAQSTVEEKEPYDATLMYMVANDSAPDMQMIEDALNELTVEALNISVDLMPVTFGTYYSQIDLILSGTEKLDLFPMIANSASSYVDAGYVVDLTDYLQYAPDAVEVLTMEDIQCCSAGGMIWGFPIVAERTHPAGIVMRKDILDELNINAEEIKTLEDLTEVYAAVHEAYPDMIVLGGRNNSTLPYQTNSIDPLGDRLGVLDHYGEDTTVVNFYETDTFRTLVEQMRAWYLAGYVSKDLATSTETNEALFGAGNLFSYEGYLKPNTAEEIEETAGYPASVYQYDESLLTTWGTSNIGYAVANNSENPERAVELYNFLATSSEANDLLNWGCEDVHWVEAEDGTATYPEGVDDSTVGYHQNFGWILPNQAIGHVWTGIPVNIFDEYQKERDTARVSSAYGFNFDSTECMNEIAALNAVVEQYVYTLCSGSMDVEEGMKEFNDALYKAGLQTVIDAKQRQLDDWIANN